MTSVEQQDKARQVAAEVGKMVGVASATVDDWSDYGLFSVLVRLETQDSRLTFKISLRGFLAGVKRQISAVGGVLESYDPPKRVYAYAGTHSRKYFDEYNTDTYSLSIRIH